MHITLTPIRMDKPLTLHRAGDILTVNGTAHDFATIEEGTALPQDEVPCDWLVSDVARIDGIVHLTLILPHGAHPPQETLFPAAIRVTEDGPIPLPPFEAEGAEAG